MSPLRLAVAVGLMFSCAHAPTPQRDLSLIVKHKAAFDLNCTEPQLTVVQLADNSSNNMAGSVDSKSFGVRGCGRRASYDAYCVDAMMSDTVCNAMQTSAPVVEP
jgi:hypothetical protein